MSQNEPIKLEKNGNPFAQPAAAEAFLKKEEMNPDVWGVMKYQGGWAIAKHLHIVQVKIDEAKEAAKPKTPVEETYSFATFNQKASENDLPYVPLSKNGKQYRVQRGEKVCLADSILEIADHASHPQWEPSDKPDQPMKRTGTIMRYQYRLEGKATKKDFDKMLKEGNLITDEEVERMEKQSAT